MDIAKDITNQHFNRLIALERAGKNKNGKDLWFCVCVCGTFCVKSANNLKTGNTKSCGCWKQEVSHKRFLIHGKSGSPEFKTWCAMRRRCIDPSDSHYHIYGGRGISFAERWLVFENFLADMGTKPTPKHTIERVDNEKGYGPDNCVWADIKAQNRNTRRTRMVTFNGITQCLTDWSITLGMDYETLRSRLSRGKTIEEAFAAPLTSPFKK